MVLVHLSPKSQVERFLETGSRSNNLGMLKLEVGVPVVQEG